jgi:hypothetical protein
MIITTGTHDSKPIEDTLRTFFCRSKVEIEKPNGKVLTECFKSMSDIGRIDKARLFLRTHANIIQTIHLMVKCTITKYKYSKLNKKRLWSHRAYQKQEEAKAAQEEAKYNNQLYAWISWD